MSLVPFAHRAGRTRPVPVQLEPVIHPGGFTVIDCAGHPVSYPTAGQARRVAAQLTGFPLVIPNRTGRQVILDARVAILARRVPASGPRTTTPEGHL